MVLLEFLNVMFYRIYLFEYKGFIRIFRILGSKNYFYLIKIFDLNSFLKRFLDANCKTLSWDFFFQNLENPVFIFLLIKLTEKKKWESQKHEKRKHGRTNILYTTGFCAEILPQFLSRFFWNIYHWMFFVFNVKSSRFWNIFYLFFTSPLKFCHASCQIVCLKYKWTFMGKGLIFFC